MIGENVLLYPESGALLRRALRISALYSNRITLVSSGANAEFLENIRGTLIDSEWKNPVLVRASDYCRYAIEAADDIEVLRSEGIISEPTFVADDSTRTHSDRLIVLLRDEFDSYGADLMELREELQNALIASPPNLFDFLYILAGGGKNLPEHLELFDKGGWVWLAAYLGFVAALTESRGEVATTCTPELMALLPKVRHMFSSPKRQGIQGLVERRRAINKRLMLRVFDRYLPTCENLSMHEILNLRRKRRAELEALHVALVSIATEINIHATEEEIELQVADLTARKVDPGVRDLEAVLKESKLEAIKKIGKSSESAIGAGVSVVLNLLLGAGVDVSAASALLGGALVPVATEAVERAKIRTKSPWSVLLRFRSLAG